MMSEYINYNGSLVNNKSNIISSSNRNFLYGDGIFETIRVLEKKPYNIEFHYKRLIKSSNILKIKLPKDFSLEYFSNNITSLIKKNGHMPAARVRFTLFRANGGLYQPLSHEGLFLIESSNLSDDKFTLNSKGLNIDIYQDINKNKGVLSNIKSCNSLIYIMAKIFATENNLDDSLILNNNNNVIEATSSNIFIVKDNKIYTPPLNDGCVDGTMRLKIIEIARRKKIEIKEVSLIKDDLFKAYEVFLTNAVSGVKWVSKFQNKTYKKKISDILIKEL